VVRQEYARLSLGEGLADLQITCAEASNMSWLGSGAFPIQDVRQRHRELPTARYAVACLAALVREAWHVRKGKVPRGDDGLGRPISASGISIRRDEYLLFMYRSFF